MRRTILSAAARPSRFLTYRRTFASSIGSKDTTPPTPIEPSQEQAHPIGAFYESILRSPPFIPETKPEAAPKSATPEVVAALPERPKPTPAAPAPAAAPKEVVEPKKVEEEAKPAKATKSSAASAKECSSPKEPAKRTRASSKKAKSVVPDPSPSPSSFSPPPSSSPPSSSISSPPPSPTSLSPSPPPTTTTSSKTQSNDPSQQDDSATPASRARIIFGRSLAGPAERAERLAAIRSQSVNIAGILVPPKPSEPDNCCMSGCVNCVWDRFRDDLEEWATLSSEAERRLLAREVGTAAEGGGIESVDASMAAAERDSSSMEVEKEAGSMDDDGGGSETNWTSPSPVPKGKGKGKEFWNEELYRNVPVGIREFMKQEKRLKEKHLREGTVGG